MFPILFKIPIFGGLSLHTYGLLVALGFLSGILWVSHESKRLNQPTDKLMDLCFYIIISAMIGSRIYYMIFEQPDFWDHPLDFFKIWEGGLVFYGGLIAAVLVSIWYFRKHHLDFWKISDIFIPGVALGHAFGRLGCFSAGCCYGKAVSESFHWGVIFPPSAESIAPVGISVYPTQLFESGAEFLIFFILFSFRKQKKFDGQILVLYLVLYSIARFSIDFLRGDTDRYLGFTSAQYVSMILFSLGIIFWIVRSKKGRTYVSKTV